MTDIECRYCGQRKPLPCMNTRDIEDFAIEGDDFCYLALVDLGGGEKGLRYVNFNRQRVRWERNEA